MVSTVREKLDMPLSAVIQLQEAYNWPSSDLLRL